MSLVKWWYEVIILYLSQSLYGALVENDDNYNQHGYTKT